MTKMKHARLKVFFLPTDFLDKKLQPIFDPTTQNMRKKQKKWTLDPDSSRTECRIAKILLFSESEIKSTRVHQIKI